MLESQINTKFDPEIHSLSDAARWIRLQTKYAHFLRELAADDARLFTSPTGSTPEMLRIRLVECGFSVEEESEDSLIRKIIEDYSAAKAQTNSGRTWSIYRESFDDEINYESREQEALDAEDRESSAERGPPYRVIYADPPWSYRNQKTGGSHKSGSMQHYDTMTVEDIAALPVSTSLAHPDGCALFLWNTTPMKPEGWHVWDAWGFKYKTTIYWVKDDYDEARHTISNGRLGMGFWFRGQVEECLVGIRGKVPAFRCQERNYVFSKSERHSKKPSAVRALIQRATLELGGPRIELFSRDLSRGWDHWGGGEIDQDIELKDGMWQRQKLLRAKKRARKRASQTKDSIAI